MWELVVENVHSGLMDVPRFKTQSYLINYFFSNYRARLAERPTFPLEKQKRKALDRATTIHFILSNPRTGLVLNVER